MATKSSKDKILIARTIADMLDINNYQAMSPDNAIVAAIRKIKTGDFPKDGGSIRSLKKLISLARENGFSIKIPDALKEDQASADYKINPTTGRKYRAHKVTFKTSGKNGRPNSGIVGKYHDDDKESVKKESFEDNELDVICDFFETEDDVLFLYDKNEFQNISEEDVLIFEQEHEVLNEVMSRIARYKAKARFARTKSKRDRKRKIALKRHSDISTLRKRARRLAVKILKRRLIKKDPSTMSIGEKERVEGLLSKKKNVIDRLSIKLLPKLRKIEMERLSGNHASIKEKE